MQIMLANACKVLAALDTPRALSVTILIRYKEWGQIADLRCDPSLYLCARAYLLDAQATDLLRKYKDLPTGRDLDEAALTSFFRCEKANAKTNARLIPFIDRFYPTMNDLRIGEFLTRVRRHAARILGGLPESLDLRFGPGATFEDRGFLVSIPDKMTTRPTITQRAIPLLGQFFGTAWGRALINGPSRGGVKVVRGDRFSSVPKDNSKNRGIGIGPSINVSLQLGVGRVMRRRLAKEGIDLTHGQDIHRRVACDASVTGEFATIDLSNASDTVSRALVKLVLPSTWFDLLDMLRTPACRVNGKWVLLEKFSAMGNGYTFELETLVFLCVCMACMEEHGITPLPGVNVFVYGDDIIVPVGVATSVLAALGFLGFEPNREKTFVKGSFRESCGGDFFEGQPVRAHFVKETPNEPHEYISLANGLRRFVSQLHGCDRMHRRLLRPWHSVLDSVPTDIRRLRGPSSLGDIVIHDSARWQTIHCRNSSRSFIRTWGPVSRKLSWQHWRPDVVLATALYGVDSRGIPMKGTEGYRKQWVALIERDPSASIGTDVPTALKRKLGFEPTRRAIPA